MKSRNDFVRGKGDSEWQTETTLTAIGNVLGIAKNASARRIAEASGGVNHAERIGTELKDTINTRAAMNHTVGVTAGACTTRAVV
jgi:hypothetical protein